MLIMLAASTSCTTSSPATSATLTRQKAFTVFVTDWSERILPTLTEEEQRAYRSAFLDLRLVEMYNWSDKEFSNTINLDWIVPFVGKFESFPSKGRSWVIFHRGGMNMELGGVLDRKTGRIVLLFYSPEG